MGHGLRVKREGIHVAFAAGTGALCFNDLIAHLILAHTSPRERVREENAVDVNKFQLHLYVSFPRRSDSVALELFEALDWYCRRENKPGFTLYVRLSQEG